MDVPGHFIPGGKLSPEITLPELLLPIVVVDIRKKARENPNAMVEVDDIKRFERKHGKIPDGALRGRRLRLGQQGERPSRLQGRCGVPELQLPGLERRGGALPGEKRDIAAIGIDTLSLDPGNSTTFPVHVQYLGTDRYRDRASPGSTTSLPAGRRPTSG